MNRLRSTPLRATQLRDALSSDLDALPDCELLDRFARYADHPAFEVLVRRHGPMVFGTCRRMLANFADADDAFQAAFLVLIRKAQSLRRADRLGPWLYGVACRVAMKARVREARRAAYRTEATDMIPDPTGPDEIPDWLPILDAELNALPPKYRDPLVLCELQGATRAECAKGLGVPEGTLSSRLARGRELLRKRLLKHGTLLPAGGLAALFTAGGVGRATVPATLLVRTSELAKGVTGAAPAGAVPVGAARLTDEVLKGMFLTKLRLAGGMLALFALVAVGLSAAAMPTGAPGAPAEEKSAAKAPAAPPGTKAATKSPAPEPKMVPPAAPELFRVEFVDSGTVLPDRDAIQGLWTVERIDVGKQVRPEEERKIREVAGMMQVLIAGDVWWSLTPATDEKIFPQRVKLDPTKNPKWIDMGEPGFGRLDELNTRGIYELDGDKLRICTCANNDRARPAEFNTDEDPPLMVMSLRRGKMPPSVGEKAILGSWVGERVGQGDDGRVIRLPTQRAEILDGYLFVRSTEKGRGNEWIGGKYTVDATKNPKWIDVELVAPIDGGKVTKLYGCYEVTDGRLKMALGTKRATRPLEFADVPDVLFLDLEPTKADAPKPDAAPAPKAKANGTKPAVDLNRARELMLAGSYAEAADWLKEQLSIWTGTQRLEGMLLLGVCQNVRFRDLEKTNPKDAEVLRAETAKLFDKVQEELNALDKRTGDSTPETKALRRRVELYRLQVMKPAEVIAAAEPLLKKAQGTTEELIVLAFLYHAHRAAGESQTAADVRERMKVLFDELKDKPGAFPAAQGEFSKSYWEKTWFGAKP